MLRDMLLFYFSPDYGIRTEVVSLVHEFVVPTGKIIISVTLPRDATSRVFVFRGLFGL